MDYMFSPKAWNDYLYWQDNDRKTRNKINDLLKDIARNGPNNGIGKPEPLTGSCSGYYSRRINDKDRLIYKMSNNIISIISCKSHYSDK